MPRPRRWTDDQLSRAVAASSTLSEVCRRIGIRPGRYDLLRRHIARIGADASHLANSTPRHRWTDDELRVAVADAVTVADVQRALGYRPSGGTHGLIVRHIRRLGLDTSHFLGRASTRGRTLRDQEKTPPQAVLVVIHMCDRPSPAPTTTSCTRLDNLAGRLLTAALPGLLADSEKHATVPHRDRPERPEYTAEPGARPCDVGFCIVKVTVLVGGVGGARFLMGVKAALGLSPVGPGPDDHPHRVDAVVNVGDDIWLHGLRICPDLDTCMYTLGGGIDTEKGWGRAAETWSVRDELAAYEADPAWFGLGDRDVATHLVRTRMLRAGYPLSQITEALCHRWTPGVRLLPATDDRVETHVVIDNPAPAGDDAPPQVAIHFQEWWIRHKAGPPAHRFASIGADEASVLPAARDSIAEADVVLVGPSNPVVSIGTIIGVPGVAQALAGTTAPIVGLSPIVGGAPVRGMADACLDAIGVETSAQGVGRHYGGRGEGGLLDGWLVHTGDAADVPGAEVRSIPLLMTDVDATAEMARRAFELAGVSA